MGMNIIWNSLSDLEVALNLARDTFNVIQQHPLLFHSNCCVLLLYIIPSIKLNQFVYDEFSQPSLQKQLCKDKKI